ncbi:beta-galactosidase small subunit [Bifidobacterium sp. ESL0764]|uniref:beta-galactosidase small subunit n=1 Tax=Bifidobacterium sp. ESL0764 TaxID=2983228 RepID=UPI0023F7BD11|nr:beta-galactosidase small subunit [Bifidobacterium sp. ESL0764]WEV65251.1 beta-galactosidase small subunit [Bifidobacterium sp. ESL0764]
MSEKIAVIIDEEMIGLHAGGVACLFDYGEGLVSLRVGGREWLYRAPRPTFWRATTDNDRGNGFSVRSAQWVGAELFSAVKGLPKLQVDGKPVVIPYTPADGSTGGKLEASDVSLSYVFVTPTNPSTSVDICYRFDATGRLSVRVRYHGQPGLPQLPAFGLRMVMPTPATGFAYFGLPGETYPDRLGSGRRQLVEVEGMPVTPYLVPQECGMRTDVDWVRITRETTLNNADASRALYSLTVASVDRPLSFTCLPYTPLELENADHQEELPPVRRTVLTVYGAVRGVGGIDSWGADVGERYAISGEQDLEFGFAVTL